MRGKPLEDTKNALSAALSKLDPGDSFNVIAFNDETYLFSSSLELATKEAIEKVTEWINMNFVAGGGTNMLLPLNKVLFHFLLVFNFPVNLSRMFCLLFTYLCLSAIV